MRARNNAAKIALFSARDLFPTAQIFYKPPSGLKQNASDDISKNRHFTMTSIRKLSLMLAVAAMPLIASCGKKNAELETDYNAKKASAETLMNDINSHMNTMKDDHTKWMAALDEASKKPGADTAKLGGLKNDMAKHMADANVIMALEDSVKTYMNADASNADAFKNADDRLGANTNDLQDKWKSFMDAHATLGKNITDATTAASADAVKTEAKPAETKKAAPAKKEAPKKEAAPAKPAASPTKSHGHGEAPSTVK